MKPTVQFRQVASLLSFALLIGGCGGVQRIELMPSIDTLRERASAQPDSLPAQRALARAELFEDDGDPARAPYVLSRALRLAPDDGGLWLLWALHHDAHGAPETAFSAYLAAIPRLLHSSEPDAPHQIEVALQGLASLQGGVADDRERIHALLERYLPSLPLPARHLAGALAMQLAYQRGDLAAATKLARRQGCITDLRVAGPFGPRDMLGFDETHAARPGEALAADYDLGPGRGRFPTRRIGARGCHLHLGGDALGAGGTRYAQGYVQIADGGSYLLTLDTPNTARVFVDGEPVLTQDRRRRLGARVVFQPLELSAGRHEITVKISSRHPNPVLVLALSRATTEDLAALPLPYEGVREPGIGMYLRATVALGRGDVLEARRVLRGAELDLRTSPLLLAQRANVVLIDPLAPDSVRTGDARRLLVTALQRDGMLWSPAVQLAGLIANGGRVKEAIAALREARERWPKVPAVGLTLAQLLRGKGFHEEADAALMEVRRIAPEACGPLQAEQAMWLRRGRQAQADAMVPALMACDAQASARLSQLRRARRWDAVEEELRRLESLEPPQGRFAWWLSRLDVARERGDEVAAARLLARLRSHYPLSESSAFEQVDGLLAAGQSAEALRVSDAALAAYPASMMGLHRIRPLLGAEHAMEAYRRDGAAAIDAYEKSGQSYAQPQVLVFDYMAVRVFADGSSLELVHTVQRVQSDEALDALAEVNVPEGARVLKLHTIKANGDVLEPDSIAGKEAVSLPAMAVGDYVEFEYLQYNDPVDGFPGGYLGERFYFRSFEVPFAHSEMVAVLPAEMEVQYDPRGDAPQMQREVRGDTQVLRWIVEQSPPLVAEPGSVAASEYIPSVRIAVGTRDEDFVDSLRELLVDRDLYDPAIAEMVGDIVGDATPEDHALRARRLYAWVLDNIEHNQDVFSQSAIMLRAHTGNRTRVLHYLLRLAGVRSALALVKSFAADQTPSEVPDSSAYDHLLLRVGQGAEATWLYTAERGAPYGYLPALLRDQPALVLVEGAERATVRDRSGQGGDRRVLELDVAMRHDGSARIDVVERVAGAGAVAWRGQLESIAEADLERRFEEQYVARLIPGARLSALSIEGREAEDREIVFRYTADFDVLGRRVEGGWAIPSLLATHLAANYAQLPSRTTTQLVAETLNTDVTLRFSFPRDATPPPVPAEVKLEAPGGEARYTQQAVHRDGVLELRRRAVVPLYRIPADDYAEFAGFCREVDAIEAREIVFRH